MIYTFNVGKVIPTIYLSPSSSYGAFAFAFADADAYSHSLLEDFLCRRWRRHRCFWVSRFSKSALVCCCFGLSAVVMGMLLMQFALFRTRGEIRRSQQECLQSTMRTALRCAVRSIDIVLMIMADDEDIFDGIDPKQTHNPRKPQTSQRTDAFRRVLCVLTCNVRVCGALSGLIFREIERFPELKTERLHQRA